MKTGRHGTYRIGDNRLSPARWKIFFSVGCGNKGNFAPQWWKFASTKKTAKVLVLHKNSHLAGINARLGKGGSISGTIRAGSKSGPGLPGACVEVDGLTTGQVAETKTGRGGSYAITGLGAGRYQLLFGPGCGNKGNFTEAPIQPVVSVAVGKTTRGVDGFLPRAGAISGTVTTGPHRRPLAGICVQGTSDSAEIGAASLAFPKAGGTPTAGVSQAKGSYLIKGLKPGQYLVEFTRGCGVASYRAQWFDGAAGRSGATPVKVTIGSVTSGIDAH